MPPQDALLDVNVVKRYGDPKPTVQMTGGELALALESASAHLGRIGIYSLGTLPARGPRRRSPARPRATRRRPISASTAAATVSVTAPSPSDGGSRSTASRGRRRRGTRSSRRQPRPRLEAPGSPSGPVSSRSPASSGRRASPPTRSRSRTTRGPTASPSSTASRCPLTVDGNAAHLDALDGPAGWVVARAGRQRKVVLSF